MIGTRAAVDVLVVGGGNAALCAAIAARRAGASVLVVEAAPKFYRGGNTRHTRNMRCAHDAATEHLSGPYTEDEFWDDLLRITEGNTDELLARHMIVQSKPMLGWIAEQGVRFQPSLGGTLSLGRTNSFFLGGGRAMLNALYLTAERLGIDVLYDSPVVALDIACGRFRSATLRTAEGDRVVSARTLVAAAGGFESNFDWLKEGWGEIAENFLIRGTPYNRGDVLKMLMASGVETTGDPTQCHAVAIDARAPKFDGGIITRLDCVVFGIVVNRHAERFYDEGEDVWPKRYAIWGRLVARQPGQIAWIVFDASSLDKFMPSLYPPIAAQSIGELAAALGLPVEALEKTVDDFNAAVQPGTFDHTVLDDCRTEGLTPPKSHWARRIESPPFYAYPVRPGITFTYLCTRVDRDARLQMRGGGAAENMFAAGEIMAGNVLGKGYAAGMGMTIGSVFGKIAGKERHVMLAADCYEEAGRLMTICNSCRYCEGLCAVFPAMELRRSFAAADLDYLANLCHGCGACYVDCQFSPPHEFDVNVPKTLAEVRAASYRSYAWPAFLRPMFDRNGLMIATVTAASVAAFILGFTHWHDRAALFTQDGHFYRLMPHEAMAGLFGAAFLFALAALVMGFLSFWREIGARRVSAGSGTSLWQAGRDAATLRYLDGGGVGCYNKDDRPADNRRLFHHLTFFGFMLCFASTSMATIYHYVFAWPAPYGWLSLPKLFGITGGIGLVIGPLGLLQAKRRRDLAMTDPAQFGMDTAFLVMMLLAGLTGLLLMALRETPAMGVMLAVHLGVVFALFLTMPYGKFVHGIYRFGALALYAAERKAGRPASTTTASQSGSRPA